MFDGELIEWHVRVEGLNDPIAVRPHLTEVVQVQPVRIGVTCGVQPIARHVFAVMGRLEQPVDDVLVRLGGLVGQKAVDLLERRRKSRQIERHATDRGPLARFGRGFEAFFVQSSQNEMVDLISRPFFVTDIGNRRALGRDE